MNCTSVCKVTYTSHQGKGKVKQPIAKKETFLTFKVNKGFPTVNKIQTELNCVFYELFTNGMGLKNPLLKEDFKDPIEFTLMISTFYSIDFSTLFFCILFQLCCQFMREPGSHLDIPFCNCNFAVCKCVDRPR